MVLTVWALLLIGCDNSPSRPPRLKPLAKGIDSRAFPIVLKYVILAHKNNVHFTKPLSVRFTDIPGGSAVGTCWMAKNFREIDIDTNYFYSKSLTDETREELIFHELTHCLCNRLHDFGAGEEYTPIPLEFMDEFFLKYMKVPKPGRYKDSFCPTSIMFPHVLWEKCVREHQQEYYKEMFNRCKPW